MGAGGPPPHRALAALVIGVSTGQRAWSADRKHSWPDWMPGRSGNLCERFVDESSDLRHS